MPMQRNQLRRLAAGLVARKLVRVSHPGQVVLRVRGRVRGRTRQVASARRIVRKGGVVVLLFRLSPAAIKQVRVRGKLRLVIRVGYSRVPGHQRERVTLSSGRAG